MDGMKGVVVWLVGRPRGFAPTWVCGCLVGRKRRALLILDSRVRGNDGVSERSHGGGGCLAGTTRPLPGHPLRSRFARPRPPRFAKGTGVGRATMRIRTYGFSQLVPCASGGTFRPLKGWLPAE